MSAARVLLAILPHPDDETYTVAGAMAAAADAGADVYLLCATRGEAGQISDPSLATPETLGAVRERELTDACAALGIHPPLFMDYRDGTLSDVDLPEAVGRIVRVVRSLRPDVVVTMGEDGVYGHPDHVALHKLVTPAFRSAAGGSRFPDDQFGAPHQPARLFWTAYRRGHFRPVWERLLTSDLAGGIRQVDPEKLGVDADQFHAAVDVRPYRARKLAAMRCHRTQVVGDDALSIFPAGILDSLLDVEHFTIAFGDRPEHLPIPDLFHGLR